MERERKADNLFLFPDNIDSVGDYPFHIVAEKTCKGQDSGKKCPQQESAGSAFLQCDTPPEMKSSLVVCVKKRKTLCYFLVVTFFLQIKEGAVNG